MANGIFNISKGRFVYFYDIVENNLHTLSASAFVIVLLKSSGLEADDTLNNYDDLSALLGATNDEADFTNYSPRKVLTDTELAALPAPDDTNNRRDLDIPDITWASAGGAANNTLGKLLTTYDSDTGAGTDSNIVPLSYHDFSATTDGNDLVAVINAAGFARAA